MAARMEKVREALAQMRSGSTYLASYGESALAEVEEWEARLAGLLATYNASVDALARAKAAEAARDGWQRSYHAVVDRCEAAEAEVAALKESLFQYGLHDD